MAGLLISVCNNAELRPFSENVIGGDGIFIVGCFRQLKGKFIILDVVYSVYICCASLVFAGIAGHLIGSNIIIFVRFVCARCNAVPRGWGDDCCLDTLPVVGELLVIRPVFSDRKIYCAFALTVNIYWHNLVVVVIPIL